MIWLATQVNRKQLDRLSILIRSQIATSLTPTPLPPAGVGC